MDMNVGRIAEQQSRLKKLVENEGLMSMPDPGRGTGIKEKLESLIASTTECLGMAESVLWKIEPPTDYAQTTEKEVARMPKTISERLYDLHVCIGKIKTALEVVNKNL